MIKQLHRWHQGAVGRAVLALAELVAAYGLASLAIYDGNLLVYLLALIFLVGSALNIIKLIGRLVRHEPKAS